MKVLKFFPYRTAIVHGTCLHDKSKISEILKNLVVQAQTSNHCCACIEDENSIFFVMFSDNKVYLGYNITEGNW